jgi:hypothetical protein
MKTVQFVLNGYGALPKGFAIANKKNHPFPSSCDDCFFLLSFFLLAGTLLFDEKIRQT